MRLSFMAIVIFSAILFWQVVEYSSTVAPKAVVVRKALPMDVPFEKMEAHTYLNSIRKAMHMQELIQNDALISAAQAHADYLVLNSESSHDEIEGHKYFTGIGPVARAFHAGYDSSQVSENLSTKSHSAHSSVDGLFSAIYHRFGFLNPGIDEIGVGTAQDSDSTENSAFVYLMGNSELNRLCTTESFKGVGKYLYRVCKDGGHRVGEKQFGNALNYNKRNNPKIILYPYGRQDEVPPGFYSEVPDPLPDYEVSGFPVSIEFNDYFFHDVEVYSFELFEEDGEEIHDIRLMNSESDPHQRFTTKQYALFPLKRLKYDTKYRVEVIYKSDNKKETVVWYFRTQKTTEIFHIVTQKEESITIESGRSHIIYFRPLNAHDIVKNIQFPSSIDIQFIDNNTLKLTHMSDDIESFDITSDTRILHIKTTGPGY